MTDRLFGDPEEGWGTRGWGEETREFRLEIHRRNRTQKGKTSLMEKVQGHRHGPDGS